ncbi:phage tail protein [Pseudomonas tremae]|uniref:Phage tail fibre protein N-terminal domain-containing protein n=2 Tax=Pseudomonas syringae group TaxID=136849 RepID=A0AB37QM75_9PSED|nr:phage tail protein [Pseudomonas coronafaciens]RMR98258.1 hypothetical protein ALP74_200094 [Pseudomonas coronafaciens pv. garcae]RMS41752.1 hypothetical protein ALP71_200276 [Pseudomonas coronafaciens pv. garcae]
MIDQTSQFFATLTNVGAAKQANADALGVPWKIAQMGVGDANGADPVPDASQKKLINERRRAPLNQLKVDPANNAIIIAEQVIPAEVGGFWIREIGLYDTDGDLVAVANCAPSFKPLLAQGSGRTQIVRINLLVSNTSNVELRIDPTVVLATRSFVDLRIQEELSKLDNKQSVRAATTGPIVLAGIQTVDGIALVAGDRVLVKNQASGKDNGLYSVVAGNAWLRVVDADVSAEVTPNLMVSVEQGDTLFDTLWQLTTNAPITLGTTALVFEQVAGPTGVLPGTYNRVTVDRRGLVMAGFNPTTLGGYGIADAYSKTEIDTRVAALQPKLGFTAVQQGTGAGQLDNAVKIGWSGTDLKATVDKTDLGKLWYSSNFNPDKKADRAETLSGYGINDAYTSAEVDRRVSERALKTDVYSKADTYTRAEVDTRDAQRYTKEETDLRLSGKATGDSITVVGFAGNDVKYPYMRRSTDGGVYHLQTRLGYVPVQAGTGVGQQSNLIKIGHSAVGVKITVDETDFGNLWYSGNFDPSSKANVGSTLAAYGINNAYTKAEVDARDSSRAIADSITHVGFASGDVAFPYMRRSSDGGIFYLQTRLGFSPVEQGGGANMGNFKLRLGYNNAGSVRFSVDGADYGDLISDINLATKVAGLGLTGIGQYAFARVINTYGNSINQGTSIPGNNLLYSSTAAGDGASSNSGTIGIGTWRAHGAFNGTERTLFQRIN